jgi:hypothetical protein
MDWNGQENLSLSCELWVGTNDFNTKKNVLVRSNPRIIFLSGNYSLQSKCQSVDRSIFSHTIVWNIYLNTHIMNFIDYIQ